MGKIGTLITKLLLLLGDGEKPKTQAYLGALLQVSQKRVSAWQGRVPPPCHALITMGNLASEHGDYGLALEFWRLAGMNIKHAMVPAAERLFQEGKLFVAVPPVEGQGRKWFVDPRMFPDGSAVAYAERDAPSEPGHERQRQIILLDTSAKFGESWGRTVLIRSSGSKPGDPELPPAGLHRGQFWPSFPALRGAYPRVVCNAFFESFDSPKAPDRRVVYVSGFDARYFVGGVQLDVKQPETEEDVRDRAMKEVPVPKGIQFLGRIVGSFTIPLGEQ